MNKQSFNIEKTIAFVVSFTLAAFLIWFIFGEELKKPSNAEKVKEILSDASQFVLSGGALASCETAVLHCDIEAEESSETCNEELLYSRIESKLRKPLEFEKCRSIRLRLADLCEQRCPLNFDSIISVPGSVRFSMERKASSEKGAKANAENTPSVCTASGKRTIVFRGECGA